MIKAWRALDHLHLPRLGILTENQSRKRCTKFAFQPRVQKTLRVQSLYYTLLNFINPHITYQSQAKLLYKIHWQFTADNNTEIGFLKSEKMYKFSVTIFAFQPRVQKIVRVQSLYFTLYLSKYHISVVNEAFIQLWYTDDLQRKYASRLEKKNSRKKPGVPPLFRATGKCINQKWVCCFTFVNLNGKRTAESLWYYWSCAWRITNEKYVQFLLSVRFILNSLYLWTKVRLRHVNTTVSEKENSKLQAPMEYYFLGFHETRKKVLSFVCFINCTRGVTYSWLSFTPCWRYVPLTE